MTTVVIVVILVVCVAVGVWFYLHGGPDGGRDPGMRSDVYQQQRLERSLEEHDTFAQAEERFQREQAEGDKPPTHE